VSWEDSGKAWGDRAADWAYLFEPYARPANDELFARVGLAPGQRLLDIACGSGFAAHAAAARGARVAGLDASEALIAIARARTPAGDFRVGDMFALPFADATFDVATSFNGIWQGCDAALVEARRVVRPGGMVGLTFWGAPKTLGLMPFFATVFRLSPSDHANATISQGGTGQPGVVEAMFAGAGLEFCERGTVEVVNEWPDLDVAVRALSSAGPSWPAIRAAGEDTFAAALREALGPLVDPVLGLRIVSTFGWATARVPA